MNSEAITREDLDAAVKRIQRVDSVYKVTTGILATALLTLMCTWMFFGRDTVKREDFEKVQEKVTQIQVDVASIRAQMEKKK